MILRSTYVLTPYSAAAEMELPLEINLDDGSRARIGEVDGKLQLVREFPIEQTQLGVEEASGWSQKLPDGSYEPLPRLKLLSRFGDSRRSVDDLVDGLSFLIDRPLNIRSDDRGKLVPENHADTELLEEVGSDEPYSATGLQVSTRTVSLEVSTENIKALVGGPRVGIRLYADALRLSLPTSRYREFWKVLESAFGEKNKPLVRRLAKYKPAQDMGFDESELEHLRQLRGRASHAETTIPDMELDRVERECSEGLPRLQCLAERVILTKKTWRARSGGVSEGAPPLVSYVRKDGAIVRLQNSRQ